MLGSASIPGIEIHSGTGTLPEAEYILMESRLGLTDQSIRHRLHFSHPKSDSRNTVSVYLCVPGAVPASVVPSDVARAHL